MFDMPGVHKLSMVRMSFLTDESANLRLLAVRRGNTVNLQRMSKNWTYENPCCVTGASDVGRARAET